MKSKSSLQQLVKQCIAEVITESDPPQQKWTDTFGKKMPGEFTVESSQPEPYDAETDAFAPGPRDRTEPIKRDIPMDMIRRSTCRDIRKAEAARKITPKSWEELDAMTLGQLQKYYNKIGLFNQTVHVPGIGWGGNPLKEAGEVKQNKISNSERNAISKAFAKNGLDGNGRFAKIEAGLAAVTTALATLGFQLDMVSKDLIMGDKGSRMFIYRRVNDPGQDIFTEKDEIQNSRIVFTWERMDGPTHQYPNSPSKFEILAYAS